MYPISSHENLILAFLSLRFISLFLCIITAPDKIKLASLRAHFLKKYFYLLIYFYLFYFWLYCVFIAALAFLQLLQAGATLCCDVQTFLCGGLSCCRARALGCAGCSRCSTWAPELWLLDPRGQSQ